MRVMKILDQHLAAVREEVEVGGEHASATFVGNRWPRISIGAAHLLYFGLLKIAVFNRALDTIW